MMTLDIGRAIEAGVSRLTARNGLLLLVAFLLVGAVSAVAQQTLNVAAFEGLVRTAENAGTGPDAPFTAEQLAQLRQQLADQRAASPLAVEVPAIVALGTVFTLALVAEAVTMVAVRTFGAPETDSLPADATDRLASATLNGFVGGIVVAVLVTIGLVLFVVPGIFLYVAFVFLRQEIALQDRNFVDALAESWELTKGDRFQVFGLVVVLFVVALAAAVPSALGSAVGLPSVAGTAIALVLSPAVTVFGVAATTDAYQQLRGTVNDESDEDEDEAVGALGPDDVPEP
jgi:hypothetical protein